MFAKFVVTLTQLPSGVGPASIDEPGVPPSGVGLVFSVITQPALAASGKNHPRTHALRVNLTVGAGPAL
jgi:hypothetical protein